MIEIRRTLQPYLKTIHPRVYFQRAAVDAVFPYLVYDLPNVRGEGQGQEQLVLDIDGWDDKDDTTILETLMAAVRDALDKHVLVGDAVVIVLHHENTLPLSDPDDKINGRKLVFQGRVFKRS